MVTIAIRTMTVKIRLYLIMLSHKPQELVHPWPLDDEDVVDDAFDRDWDCVVRLRHRLSIENTCEKSPLRSVDKDMVVTNLKRTVDKSFV